MLMSLNCILLVGLITVLFTLVTSQCQPMTLLVVLWGQFLRHTKYESEILEFKFNMRTGELTIKLELN